MKKGRSVVLGMRISSPSSETFWLCESGPASRSLSILFSPLKPLVTEAEAGCHEIVEATS